MGNIQCTTQGLTQNTQTVVNNGNLYQLKQKIIKKILVTMN